MKRTNNRPGLILLVVLGMLALFSLLAVTYVVFASQSRAASVAMSRKLVREQPRGPLFEEAIKQLIRGTTSDKSSMWGQDMLADLYGANETQSMASAIAIRNVQYNSSTGTPSPMTYASSSLQRPMLLGGAYSGGNYVPGQYLRIPLNPGPSYAAPTLLPAENDVLNGRIVTFHQGQGPLAGKSFHVVRYIGQMPFTGSSPTAQEVAEFSQCYSITIDLLENDLNETHAQIDLASGDTISGTLAEWAALFPPVTATSTWASGVYLCYGSVGLNPTTRLLGNGYSLFFNATPLNGHGVGVAADGFSQQHVLDSLASSSIYSSPINVMSVGLQTRIQDLAKTGTLLTPTMGASGATILGDTDEPYDASDWQTLFLSYEAASKMTGMPTAEIIPSFHRAALINYIVNWKDPSTYTEEEFWATLRRIELAVARPLSISVQTPNGTPGFIHPATPAKYVTHGEFTGGNNGFVGATSASSTIPQLSFTIGSPWNTNWPTSGLPVFYQWLNFLTLGPWDVDNNGDGISDSLWMDIDIPLQRTPDGQLLKALVAYYVDDLDGKLDINAIGSPAQANMYSGILFDRPTTRPAGATPPTPYAKGHDQYLYQGNGYGPADSSFRHLMGKPGLQWLDSLGAVYSGDDAAELAYRAIMTARYQRNAAPSGEWAPGDFGDDPLSILNMRERRTVFAHGTLPGLPMAFHGRNSLGLDRLGNPILLNSDTVTTAADDPYESRLIGKSFKDTPFEISEWERIYRTGDADHEALPDRLQKLFGETATSIATSTLKNEITPISRYLRVPKLATRTRSSDYTATQPTSFYQLVNSIRTFKGLAAIDFAGFQRLFPLEFHRGSPMNLNRPFGNGLDDDSDGEIDEPTELVSGQTALYTSGATGFFEDYFAGRTEAGFASAGEPLDPQVQFGPNPPNPPPTPAVYLGQQTRQMYARHFYCLAQLLIPVDYAFPNVDRNYWQQLVETSRSIDPTVTAAEKAAALLKMRQIRGRILAQWAVNLVDYRDADAAMTRFPYDMDPFDNGYAWNPVDGVVWGLEQPEALLTESLAMHDIRVHKDPAATPTRFDQYRIPQGSLFLEIYAPRSTETGASAVGSSLVPGVPSSLYTTNGSGDVVLNMSKLSPAYSGFERFPVWRVYLSNPIDKNGANPALKTPRERLVAPAPTSTTEPTRFDITYQLPSSNMSDDGMGGLIPLTTVQAQSGLVLDYTTDTAERIADPDPTESRVIVFTPGFTPTLANTPGVADPAAQVFYNRSGSDVQLHGNQYLVVGPRDLTHFGSRVDAAAGATPDNAPSANRIALNSAWAATYQTDGTQFRNATNVKPAVTMVAAADIPPSWAGAAGPPTLTEIGINVSEPLPTDADYYERPTERLNSNDNTPDTSPNTPAPNTGAPGFAAMDADAYYDYSTAGAPPKAPFDKGTKGPLQHWDLDDDGSVDTLAAANGVVKPGTELDWSTAYLQRLADPDKPWHATFNPYITVDWITIDLTVFSGEDNDSALAGDTPRLASRQKVGQTMDSSSLAFNGSGATGQTFLSLLTDEPVVSTASTGTNFFDYELPGDIVGTSVRPTSANGSNSYSTLGFLNSSFVLAAESTLTVPGLPAVYTGAPGDPSQSNPQWHPDNLFWANRQFVNAIELAYVPVSSPGQLMQEFSSSSSTTASIYEPAYRNNGADGMPRDPRMPTSPYSDEIPDTEVPPLAWPPSEWPSGAVRATPGTTNAFSHYPYSHLINFFQEMPELGLFNEKYTGSADQYNKLHPKDTSLGLLLDMLETESPWNDVENPLPPSTFGWRDPSGPGLTAEQVGLVLSNNALFAPFRAPYNKIRKHVEPGRPNLNTIEEMNVFQGLLSNTLPPSDVDFPPYESASRPFGQIEDVDHNDNDVNNGGVGTRAAPGSVGTAWNLFATSRRGFVASPAGSYQPGGAGSTLAGLFNPNYPTRFAGVFKPASEAGMVPKTRNPFVPPAMLTTLADAQQMQRYRMADQYGVLDLYSRLNPIHTTLLRARANTASPAPDSNGYEPDTTPLFVDTAASQRHAFEDLYPISRLQKLVSERSNVFAVYMTIGLFEYDESSEQIGAEYGADRGEAERFKAFYLIDRSVPVGYRVGEDHNIEDTILLRRIISE